MCFPGRHGGRNRRPHTAHAFEPLCAAGEHGARIAAEVREQLPGRLAGRPGFHGALAWEGENAVGLINCFEGFSTFAARPLLNIHDIVVHEDFRRRGIARALLAHAETVARERGCCKLTLEVLANNSRALRSYEQAGFAPYVLDPAAGHALLMQKYLPEEAA
jgi:ribosomal protein S18 acetylase RimI-like enzyme